MAFAGSGSGVAVMEEIVDMASSAGVKKLSMVMSWFEGALRYVDVGSILLKFGVETRQETIDIP